jgi:hypothetical protein
MLLLWGCEDRMIPPGTAGILVELNPLLELVNLDAAGHCAHDEIPDVVNQIVRDWLDTNKIGDLLAAEVEVNADPNPQTLDRPDTLPLQPML